MELTKIQLKEKLADNYPYWADHAHDQFAQEMIDNLDPRLEKSLTDYVLYNKESDYKYGEFSIFEIRRLRKCKFLEAIMLMDKYLKDPTFGRSYILRR